MFVFEAIQNGGKLNSVFSDLKRNLSSNLYGLKSANHMKFSEECVMCIEKHVSIKKIFTNELNMNLPLQAWITKTVYGVETQWLSCKQKVLGTAVSKESDTDNLLKHERTHHYWFLWKKVQLETMLPTANFLVTSESKVNGVILYKKTDTTPWS